MYCIHCRREVIGLPFQLVVEEVKRGEEVKSVLLAGGGHGRGREDIDALVVGSRFVSCKLKYSVCLN